MDGTGPYGLGSQTGLGIGPCGLGLRRGFRRMRRYFPRRWTGDDELEILKEEEKILSEELEAVREALEGLKSSKSK
jgi:hypothetical protein